MRYQEAGEGYPVIMVHGSGPGATGWTNFSRNIPPLASRYRIIAPDLPGWGESDSFDPTVHARISGRADALIQMMDALGIETAAFVGNSLGGAICLDIAARYPAYMSHMITMGTGFQGSPNVYSPGGMTEGIRIVRETYMSPTPENFRRMVSIFVYDSSFVTDELCQMRSEASLRRRDHLENFLKTSPNAPQDTPAGELMAGLAAYQAPTLLIHGRDDRVVPLENSLKLVSLVPNSQANIFNRCGHWTQIEHADAFNGLVDVFLQTNGIRPRGGSTLPIAES